MTVFLDSELTPAERQADTALFHVIPVPLERTVSYGAGTAQGPDAILNASNELERLCANVVPCAAGIHTQPALDCDGPLPEVMERLAERTEQIVRTAKIPVTLGGEHALSFGAVRGITRALNKEIGLVQIDAHADLRQDYQGNPHSHASVMQLLAEEGIRIAQFGVRALCAEECKAREKYNVFFRDAEDLVTKAIHSVPLPNDFPEDIYISFDVDGLDPAYLPATGTPVPGGLSYYQALHLIEQSLVNRRCVGMDIVELAPDGNPAWDFTAAQIIYRMMAAALNTQKSTR